MDNRLPKPDPPTRAIPRLDTGRAGPVALIGADLARFQDIAASAEDHYGWTAFRIGDRLSLPDRTGVRQGKRVALGGRCIVKTKTLQYKDHLYKVCAKSGFRRTWFQKTKRRIITKIPVEVFKTWDFSLKCLKFEFLLHCFSLNFSYKFI